MIEVKYCYSTSRACFANLAEAISDAAGEKVFVIGNRLMLPPSLGCGRFEFYELDEGLSIMITDCVFYKNIQFNKTAISGNDNYKILFNISEAPLIITNNGGRKVDLSESLANSVFFSSHATGSDLYVSANQTIKTVHLIFSRSWGISHLMQTKIPLGVKRLQQFSNCLPMQFATRLDLRNYDLLKEMFSTNITEQIFSRLLEGYAYRLIALFFNNIVEEEINEKHIVSEEAMRIIQLKEQIEKNFDKPIPTLAEAAEICLISRTKFISMFKTMYFKNYSEFFLDQKMEKAKNLLEEGCSLSRIGLRIGCKSTGHFIKLFKSYYGVTPGVYQRKSK